MERVEIPEAIPVESDNCNRPQPALAQAASGRAIVAMVLGIFSLLCLGFLAGIPAIVLGYTEIKAIREGKSPPSGDSAAKAGLILGILGTALSLLILGFVLVVMLLIGLGTWETARGAGFVI